MALIYCRECGEQISEHAQSCPKCGAPSNPEKKKGNNNGLLIIIFILMAVGICAGYYYFTSQNARPPSPETRQEKIDVADRMLSKDCGTLINMLTEYIKNDVAVAIIRSVGITKCDCIKEKLREKLADKYTLSDLQAFAQKPLHEVKEIKDLVEENSNELISCFPLINQIKDKVIKK